MEFFQHFRSLPFTKSCVLPRDLIRVLLPLCKDTAFSVPKQETVVIDYSSVNIAKPIHAGHLRATLVGHATVRLNKALGHKVIGINYLGDWGTQFGYLIHGHKSFGNETEFLQDPVKYMFHTYVKAYALAAEKSVNVNTNAAAAVQECARRLESRDPEMVQLWRQFRESSLHHLRLTYKRMGISFTEFEFESDYVDIARDLVQDLERKELAVKDESGCFCFRTENGKKVPLLKSDGSSLYLSRDLAAILSRFERYHFDRVHYVVENGQHEHFQYLRSLLLQLSHHPISTSWIQSAEASEKFHVKFGRVAGLSTRQGNVVLLQDMLDTGQTKMLERMRNSPQTRVAMDSPESAAVAESLALSVLLCEVLRRPRQKPVEFTWAEDNAGVGLQYCHSRLCSLLFQAMENGIIKDGQLHWPEVNEAALGRLMELDESVAALIQHIGRFPAVIWQSYRLYETNVLVDYVLRLKALLQKNLRIVRVLDPSLSVEDTNVRLNFFMAGKVVLASSMHLLGMTPLKKM